MSTLVGKTAVVTGAAGGVGLGLVRALLDRGARVVTSDVDEARLEAVTEPLRSDGAEVFGVVADVSHEAAVDQLRDTALERFGTVQLAFSNAGGPLPTPVDELTRAEWDFVLGTNLFGVVHGIQAFLPVFERQGEGHLCATSSISGLVPFPPVASYNVAKSGVNALMETLALELRARGSSVGVSVLCPGPVATRGIEHFTELSRARGIEAGLGDDERAEVKAGLLRHGMDPLEVGRRALEGIERGRFWIFTHPDWVTGPLQRRHDAMTKDGDLAGPR